MASYPVHPATVTRHGGFYYNRGLGVIHAGLDLAAKRGQDVYAPEDGIVVAVENGQVPPWRRYAPILLMKGASGFYHLFSHLEGGTQAFEGTRVTEGQRIAAVGNLRHVHWEVRRKPWPTSGKALTITVDPHVWLGEKRPKTRTSGLVGCVLGVGALVGTIVTIGRRRGQ